MQDELENYSKQLQDSQERLRALHQHALRLGTASNVDEIVKSTLDAIEFALGFDVADIYIVAGDSVCLRGARGAPIGLSEERINGRGLVAKAARTQVTVHVSDTTKEPDYVDRQGWNWTGPPTILSELAVPIIIEGKTAGVLNVEDTRPASFNENDQILLETLAAHVAFEMQRLRNAEELRRSSQFLGAVIENANVWLNVLDEENKVVIWNRAAEVISGYSREEVLGHDKIWSWLFPDEEYRKQLTDSVNHLLQVERAEQNVETNIRRKDGQTRTISWNERALLDEHGKAVGSVAIGLDVTERKLDENEMEQLVAERTAKLAESEKRFRELVENIPQKIFVKDRNSVYVSCNLRYAQDLNINPDEIAGRTDYDFHPRKLADHYRADDKRIIESGKTEEIVEKYVAAGRESFIDTIKTPIRDTEGKVTGLLGIFWDITQRHEMEEKMRESEARYRRLFESSPVSLWEEDFSDAKKYLDQLRSRGIRDLGRLLSGCPEDTDKCANMVKIVDVNAATLRLYGAKSVDELRGELRKIFTPDFRKGFIEELVALSEGQREFACEFDNRTLSGETKHVSLVLTVIPGFEDTLSRVLVSITDLTDRKKMEEQLRESRDELEQVLATNPAVLYYEEPLPDFSDTVSTFVSESARFVLGFEPEKLLGKSGLSFWRSRIHPDDLARYWAELPLLWKDGHHIFEYRFLHSDGKYRWITEQYSVIRDAGGRISHSVAVAIDSTERKQLEERLSRAERLAAIGETAAQVGHDLRNPLQGIAGALYMLRKPSLPEKEKDEMLQLIQDSVRYSDGIVRDLTEYSNEIHLEPTETTPKAIIGAALPSVRVPENVMLQDLSEDRPPITVDRNRIMRVIVNIVQNAIDAMPKGGTLTISSKQSDRMVEIALSDTGPGMAEKIVQNLWKPFQTTKAKGLGLGLAICKRIVEAHGGVISVDSKAGAGTTVRLGLPIRPQAMEVKEK